ncbi:hypothetical protein [Actinacidiphila bryophytorum]|uniref:DUF4402 domain-containing protein n=1 Tax=Actinacidiphila bryophytorum TaxID=1436133 RepID=A0A9W4H2W0_9ACTN|nr:hypothetical protein [Actinacidiphila bryophytorum]MBM9437155.1 hypothetical protein [Actinacidiphila bryophytorum]MBN6542463.1 hypothetical protein [Actinacidiphila bryophytorum]CAG7646884.1 conserved exported hypothetical protein [Actinacidiphila bryophytorum]
MRSTHHRLRSLGTVAALTLLGGSLGLSSAAAAQVSPLPIGPGQTFVGQVNGVTIGAVVKVGCFGPVTPTSTGHPVAGQTVSVQLIAGNAPDKATVGYTGDSATHDLVGFGNPTSAAPATEIKAYGIGVEIPATLNLPCYGTGTIGFIPAPTSAGAQTATVDVTYVSIGLTPAG